MSLETYLNNNNDVNNYHIGAMFLDCMKSKRPEGIFQIDAATGEEETNKSVLSRCVRLARCFRKIGLKPGDVLALGGKNHLDLHIPYYAAMINGYPVVGVDPYYKYAELRNLFKLTAPKIAFCQHENAELYAQTAADLGIDVKIITFDGDYTLAKFMEENDDKDDSEEPKAAEFDTHNIYAWLVSTSGTSGMPKVAAFKHKTLITQMIAFIRLSNRNTNTDEQRIGLNLAPVQWISAYFNAVALPLMNQVKLQTSTPEDIGHIIDVINKYKPASLMSSPSAMALILKHEKQCDFTCFDNLTLTGSKVYRDLTLNLQKRLKPGAVLMEAYGQTETVGPALMPNPRGPLGNCGVPTPNREVKLVDPETGIEVKEPNVPGELWTRGPSFTEYYNSPEDTAKAFTEDGWYRTGDLLYRDENNNFFFFDRLNMLIKYRNYHINPVEVEEVIAALPGVLEAALVGRAHAADGQRAAAAVVRRAGCPRLTAAHVKDIVANTLAPSKQLRGGVVFLDSLPKTSTGKVARAELTKLVATLQTE